MAKHDYSDEHEKLVKRRKPRTMGLKMTLQREREQGLREEELSFEESIANEINEDGEFWLEKVNTHFENLLDNSNRITIFINSWMPSTKQQIGSHTSKSSNCKTSLSKT